MNYMISTSLLVLAFVTLGSDARICGQKGGWGWCLDENGIDQHQGMVRLSPRSSVAACIHQCKSYPGATGCEVNHYGRQCSVHTRPISRGNYRRPYQCFKFQKCEPTSCTYQVGQGYGGKGFYSAGKFIDEEKCALKCKTMREEKNSAINMASYRASDRACWCRISTTAIRSSDTKYISCFLYTNPTTCTYQVGQGYGGKGFYSAGKFSDEDKCALKCKQMKEEKNPAVNMASYRAANGACWCRISSSAIRSSDTKYRSCFLYTDHITSLTRMTYLAAVRFCESEKMRLAYTGFESMTTRKEVASKSGFCKIPKQCRYWFGLNKMEDGKTWRWLDGKAGTKQDMHWYFQAQTQAPRQCAYLISENSGRHMQTDNYQTCNDLAFALCEKI